MAVFIGGISGVKNTMFGMLYKNTVDYAVSLKNISDKKKVLKLFLSNINDYSGSEIEKTITKDNLKYILTLKSVSNINKALRTSLNAIK